MASPFFLSPINYKSPLPLSHQNSHIADSPKSIKHTAAHGSIGSAPLRAHLEAECLHPDAGTWGKEATEAQHWQRLEECPGSVRHGRPRPHHLHSPRILGTMLCPVAHHFPGAGHFQRRRRNYPGTCSPQTCSPPQPQSSTHVSVLCASSTCCPLPASNVR